jgi:hypothetical protein
VVAEGSERPLEPNIVLLLGFVFNELFVFLVDGVVGKVHVAIVFIELGGVGLRGKPSQTFLIDVYT